MKTLKWETIKRRAVEVLIKTGESRENAEKRIDNYDVRQVGVLVRQFPDTIPYTWRRRTLRAEISDTKKPGWIVYPVAEKGAA